MIHTSSPWKKISSSVPYKNPWLSVREDKVIQPDGQESIYGVVEGKEFAMVIPQIEPGRFFMIKQYRYPVHEYSLEFPAGGVKQGETVEEALRREMQEEAQLQAAKLTKLGCLDVASNFSSMHYFVYLAEQVSPASKRAHDPSEGTIDLQVLSEDEILKAIQEGIIRDSQTLAAFSLFIANR